MWKKIIMLMTVGGLFLTNFSPTIYSIETSETTNTEETSTIESTFPILPDEDLSHVGDESMPERSPSEEEIEESTSSGSEEKEKDTDSSESEVDESLGDETEESSDERSNEDESDLAISVGEVEVDNWKDFAMAVSNENISKIVIISNLKNPSIALIDTSMNGTGRKSSLEIDGRGHEVDFYSSYIQIGKPENQKSLFHMHDIIVSKQPLAASVASSVINDPLVTNSAQWEFRLGNIRTKEKVDRLAQVRHAKVTLYGTLNIHSVAENFLVGSVEFEDYTNYTGKVDSAYSVFYYESITSSLADSATGKSREFTVGKNCTVNLSNVTDSMIYYPAVYYYFSKITIGKNSIFNVNMPGNAVRFNHDNSSMVVEFGAVVNLKTRSNDHSTIAYNAKKSNIRVNPGSYFYVTASSYKKSTISFSSDWFGETDTILHTGNSLIIDNPAQFDIRNNNLPKQDKVNLMYLNSDNHFMINDSTISLWNKGVDLSGSASGSYPKKGQYVNQYQLLGEKIETSEEGLKEISVKNFSRVAGINENPSLEWLPVLDAKKTIEARVVVGYMLKIGEDNKFSRVPVYATKDEATVTLTDTAGNQSEVLTTDSEGYISYTPDYFQEAGKKIIADVRRNSWLTTGLEYTVLDVTPPEPAKLVGVFDGKISSNARTLTGTGEEGSFVIVNINGKKVTETIVDKEKKWYVAITNLSTPLKNGDIIQVFLQDHSQDALKLPREQRPSTFNNQGNTNPSETMLYYDREFKGAIQVRVAGLLEILSVPSLFDFGNATIGMKTQIYYPKVEGKLEISDTRDAENKKPWMLKLKEAVPLTSEKYNLLGTLYYNKQPINSNYSVIETESSGNQGITNISDSWSANPEKGLSLKVPVKKQLIGNYQGILEWSLEDVVENN